MVRNLKPYIFWVFVLSVFGLVACGGGGSGAAVDPTDSAEIAQQAGPTLPPTTPEQLTAALTTRFDSADSYDYWQCAGNAGTAYNILAAPGKLSDQMQRGLNLFEPGGSGIDTLWSAPSADSLFIEYPSFGQGFDFTGLVFDDINTLRIAGSDDGPLVCTRESYPAGTVAGQPLDMPAGGDNEQMPPIANPQTPPSSGSLPAVVAPPGIAAFRGIQVFRIQPSGFFGLTDDAIFTFTDGSYTEDVAGVMTNGIAASMAANPEDWGVWRGSGDNFELLENGDTEFDDVTSWILQPAGADQRLDGCYNAIGGSGALFDGGIGNVDFSTVCFFSDGRFTHDSAFFTQGPFADSSTVSPQSVGIYRIDGNAARFVYNDGRDEVVAFGINTIENGSVASLYLNDDLHVD